MATASAREPLLPVRRSGRGITAHRRVAVERVMSGSEDAARCGRTDRLPRHPYGPGRWPAKLVTR